MHERLDGDDSEALDESLGCPERLHKRLRSMVKVPVGRLDDFIDWPEEKVRDQAQRSDRQLKRFIRAVINALEDPESTSRFLADLDLRKISRDHDWRAVFVAVQSYGHDYQELKRTVLIRYLQYLGFKKRLLEFVHSRRSGLEGTDAYAQLSDLHEARGSVPGALPDQGGVARGGEWLRLPLGESVDIDVAPGIKVEIALGAHVFHIIGGRPSCMLDQNGVMYILKQGRNLVGRHPDSDVLVDPDFGAVSRTHLILEWDGGLRYSFVDFSTRGTYLRPAVLSRLPRQ